MRALRLRLCYLRCCSESSLAQPGVLVYHLSATTPGPPVPPSDLGAMRPILVTGISLESSRNICVPLVIGKRTHVTPPYRFLMSIRPSSPSFLILMQTPSLCIATLGPSSPATYFKSGTTLSPASIINTLTHDSEAEHVLIDRTRCAPHFS